MASLRMLISSSSGSDSSNDNENFGCPATPHQNLGNPIEERSESSPKSPSPPKSRSSAERVVDESCGLHEIGESRLFTDHDNLFPFGLSAANSRMHQSVVTDLLKHSVALKLLMMTTRDQAGHIDNEAEGQACFVSTTNGIVMATVNHNLCREYDKDGDLEQCFGVILVTLGEVGCCVPPRDCWKIMNWDARNLTHQDEKAFKFSNPKNPDAAWKYGKELVIFPLSPTDDQVYQILQEEEIRTFKAVSTSFVCELGMQVGIMANSCTDLLATSLEKSLTITECAYKAQKGDTFITVGTITHVGADHIEYTANTVPGFAGGPVCLLNGGEDGHMNLLAIHAGYSESLATNFGFLVTENVGND